MADQKVVNSSNPLQFSKVSSLSFKDSNALQSTVEMI